MVVIAALIIVAALAVFVVADRRFGVLRQRRRSPVVVTLKSGSAFRGVLAVNDRHALVLQSAEALDKSAATPVDGEIIIPWGDVKYMQRP